MLIFKPCTNTIILFTKTTLSLVIVIITDRMEVGSDWHYFKYFCLCENSNLGWNNTNEKPSGC